MEGTDSRSVQLSRAGFVCCLRLYLASRSSAESFDQPGPRQLPKQSWRLFTS